MNNKKTNVMTSDLDNLTELTDAELESANGGLLSLSSALGHLGRAFAVGYAIGSGINWLATQGGDSDHYDAA